MSTEDGHHHHHPGPDSEVALRARARVTNRGRTICFCQVDVRDEADGAVATALVSYRLG